MHYGTAAGCLFFLSHSLKAALLVLLALPAALDAAITGATSVGFVGGAVYATHAPGDTDRLFVVDRDGDIRIVDLNSNTTLTTPYLTIDDTDGSGEGGLLGLAFHPDYQTNGKFYVYVTVDNGGVPIDGGNSPFSSRIREYTVSSNPNVADASTKKEVLNWVQPRNNHNGGWIGFSPNDDHLYITSGDGGKQGDPDNNAQTLTGDLLGKVLRIDVNGDDFPADSTRNYAIPATNPFVGVAGDDEIWSYGLRNPWRASFDRQTGDLWVADVGQDLREEINFQPGDSPGGENYAWSRREGFISHQGGALLSTDTQPVYDYQHGSGAFRGNSVAGGFVYRGADPDLRGDYFFLDSASDNIWMFDPASPTTTVDQINSELGLSGGFRVGFGEDADGNLYILDLGGSILRIDTTIQLPGDYDGSGTVDAADYTEWRAQYGQNGPNAADGNGDGLVDGADYALWRDNLGRSLAGSQSVVASPEPSVLGSLLLVAVCATPGFRRR